MKNIISIFDISVVNDFIIEVNMQTKRCPFCAEEIFEEAIKCKHCGEFLNNNKPVLTIKEKESVSKQQINMNSSDTKIQKSSRLNNFTLKLYFALYAFLGLLSLSIGIYTLFYSVYGGLCFIIISLLLLPTVRKYFYSKIKITLSNNIRNYSILILLLASFVFILLNNHQRIQEENRIKAKEKADRIARIHAENIKYFNNNRMKIINLLQDSLKSENYLFVINNCKKYLSSNNLQLVEIDSISKIKQADKIKKIRTEKLKNELKKLKANEYTSKLKVYEQLAKMYPENKNYKTKYNQIAKTIKEEARIKEISKILSQLKNIPSSKFEENQNLYKKLMNLDPRNKNYKDKYDYYTVKIKEKNNIVGEKKKSKPTQYKTIIEAIEKTNEFTIENGTLEKTNNNPLHIRVSPTIVKGDLIEVINEEARRSILVATIIVFAQTSVNDIIITSVPSELDFNTGKRVLKNKYNYTLNISRSKLKQLYMKYFKIKNCWELIGERKYGNEILTDQFIKITDKILYNDQGAPGLNVIYNELLK